MHKPWAHTKSETHTKLTTFNTAEDPRIAVLRAEATATGGEQSILGRREFLRSSLAVVAGVVFGAVLGGCSDSSKQSPMSPTSTTATTPSTPTTSGPRVDVPPEDTAQTQPTPVSTPTSTGSAEVRGAGSKVLLAYFSRAGENYYYGGRTHLEVGNTEVVAGMISRLIGCHVHRIEAADPYSDSYSETVERNVLEQETNARPEIANPLASIESYDMVLLGSPIWNVRAPMIMSTFVEGFNFTGKTVFPFTTHAMSGLGTTVRDYAASCPGATIGEGLAVQGEEVQNAEAAVEAWLRRINLLNT